MCTQMRLSSCVSTPVCQRAFKRSLFLRLRVTLVEVATRLSHATRHITRVRAHCVFTRFSMGNIGFPSTSPIYSLSQTSHYHLRRGTAIDNGLLTNMSKFIQTASK